MVLYGDTNASLSKALGISPQSLYAKINEKNSSEFVQREMKFIKDRYHLDDTIFLEIFFDDIAS